MVLISEIFNHFNLFFSQVKTLKLFNSSLLVLHPQNPIPIKIKGDINFRYFKLPISPDLALSNINLIQIIFLLLELRSLFSINLRID